MTPPCVWIWALPVGFVVPAATAAASIPGPAEQDPGIQSLKRVLLLEPDFGNGTLSGSSVLTISNASQEPITRVPLIMYHMLHVTSARTSDGRTLEFTEHVVPMKGHERMLVNSADIALNRPMPPGGTLTLRTQYAGTLGGYEEAGHSYLKDHVNGDFTIIRSDCLAYPIVCRPTMDDYLKSIYHDLKHGWDYYLEVTVPADLVVANGGRSLENVSQNGMVTYRYESIKPAWRIDICIGRYRALRGEDSSLTVFSLPDSEEQAGAVLSALSGAMHFLSECFGPAPEFEAFAVIEVPDGYGSQADRTCILQEADAFRGNLHRIYHEVSHLWNPPAVDEHPSRFESEGLATFLEYWLQERLDGRTGQLEEGLELCRQRFCEQCRRDPRYRDTPIADYGTQDLTDASYTKGMIAFWILYRLVGEQAFLETYRTFCLEYRQNGATLEDFIRIAKKGSERDLEKFLDEWIYGAKSSGYLLDGIPFEQILRLYEVEQGASGDPDKPRR